MTSFDSILGASSDRYLARGYRQVQRELAIITVDRSRAGGRRQGTASVVVLYPHDWSTKPGGKVTPHLSSLDGMVLAAELIHQRAAHYQVTAPIVTQVSIKAGARPVPTTEPVPMTWTEELNQGTLQIDAEISSLKVSIRADVCDRSGTVSGPRAHSVGPLASVAWGPDIESTIARISTADRELESIHRALSDHANAQSAGMSTSLTFPDFLRLAAQSAQVLIYSCDGIARSASNNIWMRRANFHADADLSPRLRSHRTSTRILEERTLQRARRTLRVFDVEFVLDDAMWCNASLAYSLED